MVEFNNYKEAKDARAVLAKLYTNEIVKIESQLLQVVHSFIALKSVPL